MVNAHRVASSMAVNTVAQYEALISEFYGPISFSQSADEPFFGQLRIFELGWMQISHLYTANSLKGVRKTCQNKAAPRNMLLMLGKEGRFSVTQHGRMAECDAGSLALVDTGNAAVSEHTGTSDILTFRMPSSLVTAHFRGIESGCSITADARCGSAAVLRDLMISIWKNRHGIADHDLERLPSSVLNLIGLVFLEPSTPLFPNHTTNPLFKRIKGVVAAHLEKHELSAEDVSRWLGVSRSLIYATTQRHGTTLGEMIMAERLERCRSALADPAQNGRTITDVALAWGFQSSAHFSRRFREKFGESPSDFKSRILSATWHK